MSFSSLAGPSPTAYAFGWPSAGAALAPGRLASPDLAVRSAAVRVALTALASRNADALRRPHSRQS
ncbi:exported hypothetical protein [Hyphomicrobium sp. GJ21]|nr:exported hypothetical protein [Hyphomicrobium sp. GJ21]